MIGEDFELAKQNHEFVFKTHYDNDGRIKLDIKEGDKWIKERQTTLQLIYRDKNFSQKELTNWLDKKLRFTTIDKFDKTKFIENAINYQLKTYHLSDLSINRFVFRDKLDEIITTILINYAKNRFDQFIKKGSISILGFDKFPSSIIVSEKINEKFKKNYYQELGKLNSEELSFIQRIDSEALPNIKYWIRNVEKNNIFYLQGWKPNRFYPDFIVLTKKGNILALEWKGKDRVSNEDTGYKVEVVKVWEKLGKGKLHFFLVNMDNVEEVLTRVKYL